MKIQSQNKMVLVNTSESDPLVVPRGTLVAGFGKGKWERCSGESDDTKQTPYKLSHHDDLVLSGSDLIPLLDVVNERRKTHPDCRVSYHELAPQGEGPPGGFALQKTVDVLFTPQPPSAGEQPAANLQTRVAATAPLPAWSGHYSRLVWSVKWNAAGLTPVRPQIAFVESVTIRPGHMLLMN